MDNVISNIQTSLHEVHGRFESSGLNLTSLTNRVNALEAGIDEDFSNQLSLKADKSEVAKFTSNSNVITTYNVSQLGEKLNSFETVNSNLQSSKVDKARISFVLDDNGNDVSEYTLTHENLGGILQNMDNQIESRALASRVASFTVDGVLTDLSVTGLGARLVTTEANLNLRALKSEVSTHTDANDVTTKYGVTSLGAELYRIGVILSALDEYVLKTEVSRLEENGEVIDEYTLNQDELGVKLKSLTDSIANFVASSEVSKNYDTGTTNYTSNPYTLSDYELGAMLQRFDSTHLIKSQVSKRYYLNSDGTASENLDSEYTLSDFALGTKLFDVDTLLSTKISGEEVSINTSDTAYTLNQTELGTMLKTLTGRVDLVSPDDADSSIFALKTSVATGDNNPAYTFSTTALATKLESIDDLLASHEAGISTKASLNDVALRAYYSMVSLKYQNDDGVTIDEKFTCSVPQLGSLLYDMDADIQTRATKIELAAAVSTALAGSLVAAGAYTASNFLSSTLATLPGAVGAGITVAKTAADLVKDVFGSGADGDTPAAPPAFIRREEGVFKPANYGNQFNNGLSTPMIEGRENVAVGSSDSFVGPFGDGLNLHAYIINLVAGYSKVFYRDVSYTSKVRLLGSSSDTLTASAQYGPPASTSYFFPAPAGSALVDADLAWGASTNRTQYDGTALTGYSGGVHSLSCFGISRFEGRTECRKVAWLSGSGTLATSTLDAKLAFDGTSGDAPIHIFGESSTKFGLNLHDAGIVMRNPQSNAKIDIKYHSSNLVFASLTPNAISTSPDILESILTVNSSSNSVGISGGASSQYKLYVHGGAKFTSGITSPSVVITGNNTSAPFLAISNTTVGAKKEFSMSANQDGLTIEYGTATSGVVVKDTRISMDDAFTTIDSVGTNSGLEIVGKLGNKASMVLRHMPNADTTKGTVTLGRYLSIKNDIDASRVFTGYTSLDATELIHMNNSAVTVKGNLNVAGDISVIDTSVTPNTSTNIVSGLSTTLGRVSTLINGGDLSMLRSDGTSTVVRAANIESIGHPAYTVTDAQGVATPVERTGLFRRPNVLEVDKQIEVRLTSIGLTEGLGTNESPLVLNVRTIDEINGIINEGHVAGSVSGITFSDSETLGSKTFPSVAITPASNPFITDATITNTIVGIKRVTVSGNSSEQGSGYVAGDTITISDSFGTGTNAVFTVVDASSGGVDGGSTSLTITNPGAYTSISGTPIVMVDENPTYPAVTGITQQSSNGSGTGVTFSVELSVISVEVFNAGKGYVTSPSVVVSGTYVNTVGNTTTTSGIQSATAVLHTTSNITVLDSRFSKAATISISNTATQLNTALSGYVSNSDLETELANFYNIDEIIEGYAPIAATGETYAYLSTTSLQNYQTTAALNLLYQTKEDANNVYIKASDLTASDTGFYDKTTSDGRYQAKPATGQSFALASSIVGLIGTSTTSLTNYTTTNDANNLYQAKELPTNLYITEAVLTAPNTGFYSKTYIDTLFGDYSTTSVSNNAYQAKEASNDPYAHISDIPTSQSFTPGDKVRILKYSNSTLGGYLQGYDLGGGDGGLTLGASKASKSDRDAIFIRHMDAGCRVGIGNSSPGFNLDVTGTANVSSTLSTPTCNAPVLRMPMGTGAYSIFARPGYNGAQMMLTAGSYSFANWNGAHHLDVYSSFNPSNGSLSGARTLYLNYFCGGYVRLVNGTLVSSDDRLKINEKYIENATETLLKLKPQIYTKIHPHSDDGASTVESGLIVQDVYYDAPELRHLVHLEDDADVPDEKPYVDDDPQIDPDYSNWGEKYASFRYEGLIAYLIKAIQENDSVIQGLQSRLSALEPNVVQQ